MVPFYPGNRFNIIIFKKHLKLLNTYATDKYLFNDLLNNLILNSHQEYLESELIELIWMILHVWSIKICYYNVTLIWFGNGMAVSMV